MIPDPYSDIHRIKYKRHFGKGKIDHETRAMLGYRLRCLYRQLGMNRAQAAQFLHVSERTLHNWETGVHEIPYTAYKLLRLMTWSELPGQWKGWHLAAGKLWSPEGFGFEPHESSFWSNLCRRSEMFGQLYRQVQDLNRQLQEAQNQLQNRGSVGVEHPQGCDSAQAVQRHYVPVTRNLSLTFETNHPQTFCDWTAPTPPSKCPAELRYASPKILIKKTVKGGRA